MKKRHPFDYDDDFSETSELLIVCALVISLIQFILNSAYLQFRILKLLLSYDVTFDGLFSD